MTALSASPSPGVISMIASPDSQGIRLITIVVVHILFAVTSDCIRLFSWLLIGGSAGLMMVCKKVSPS